MLSLRFCARAFSSCGKRGPLFIAVRGPLTIAASLVAEHRLQTRRLSSCGSRAPLLRGMWDLPRPGLEPVCPALAGWFSTTAPPGKPPRRALFMMRIISQRSSWSTVLDFHMLDYFLKREWNLQRLCGLPETFKAGLSAKGFKNLNKDESRPTLS